MKFNRLIHLTWLGALLLTACAKKTEIKTAPLPEPTVDTNKGTVTFVADAPQLSSLIVEPAQIRSNAVSHATGRLAWDDELTVRIFTPVAGRVIRLRADLGDQLTNGSPLAEIDSPDFGQALANARTAIGNLAAADKAYARSQDLLKHGAAAQKDVEAAQAAYVAAMAERDRANSVLANYGGSVTGSNSIYVLRTPLAGELVERNITPGQELRADLMLANAPNLFAPLFVVSDPTELWIYLDVPINDLAEVQVGQRLEITSTALSDRSFDGKLDFISSELDPSTRTVHVRGIVKNPDKILKAEMYVSAAIVQNNTRFKEMGVEIPGKAIFMMGGDSYLFTEEAQGKFQRKLVKVGVERDGKVPVFQGVAPGEKVVTDGCLLLQSLIEPSS